MRSKIRLALTAAAVGAAALLSFEKADANQRCASSTSSMLNDVPFISASSCGHRNSMGMIEVSQRVQLTANQNDFYWQPLARQPIRGLEAGEILVSNCRPTRSPGPGIVFISIVDGRHDAYGNYKVKATWMVTSSSIQVVGQSGPKIFCKARGWQAGE